MTRANTLLTMLSSDRDASVVVTVVPLALVLVYVLDTGVHYAMWYSSVLPALAKDFAQCE